MTKKPIKVGTKLKHYSVPHLIHIEMSYACNSKCFFCYNPYRDSPIDYNIIDKLVASIHKSKIPHVYLIGGEPSLLDVKKINQYIDTLSKNSSVTIVTNGLIHIDNLSRNLACIGVAIHGNPQTQEWLSGIEDGYSKTVDTISKYVKEGFDVRCIPVLTSKNFDQIYDIIKLAKRLGMESVFVDKFEIGGMGLDMANQLKPTLEQFKVAVGQMIKARDDFNIPVGFGTAIPYCLDERLIKENMTAECGVGVTFGAVSPQGDLRICNQSEIVYGNILKEPTEEIWNKKSLDDFRNLEWVTKPCSECNLVEECTGGCKVDLSCSKGYCIDYHIRENLKDIVNVEKINQLAKERDSAKKKSITYPQEYRNFVVDGFTKLNLAHKEKYLITRYQTIVIDEISIKIIKEILKGETDEAKIIKKFKNSADEKEIRKFLSQLESLDAIHSQCIQSIDWEITKHCNLNCLHCISYTEGHSEELSLEQQYRLISKLKLFGLKEISFTGGEPFFNQNLLDLIKLASSIGIKSRVITNGILMNEKFLRELCKHNVDLGISLDGINKDSNDRIRGKGSFESVIKTIKMLRKSKLHYDIYFTVNSKEATVKELINFAKKLGAKGCRINEITERGKAAKSSEIQSIKIPNEELAAFKIPSDLVGCSVDSENLFVNSNGECFPCVEYYQTGGELFGNLLNASIPEVMDKVRQFGKKNLGKPCPYNIYIDEYTTICTNNSESCRKNGN